MLSANNAHGLPRTNVDKCEIVSLLLADVEWSHWSDREIARHCQVSNRFVSNMRRRSCVNGSHMTERKARRGGTVFEVQIAEHPTTKNTDTKKSEDRDPNGLPLCSLCPLWWILT